MVCYHTYHYSYFFLLSSLPHRGRAQPSYRCSPPVAVEANESVTLRRRSLLVAAKDDELVALRHAQLI
jgi:hypothetical protein